MRFDRISMIVMVASSVLMSGSPSWNDDTTPPQATPSSPQDNFPSQPVAKPEPAPAAKPEPPLPPSVTVIEPVDARGILGRDIRSPAAENMGRIVDVVVDRSGQVRGAVIDFGGFLGVGSRKIVVDWNALHFWNVANKSESITLELTRDQVRAAPEYKEDQPIVVLGAAGNLEPLRLPLQPAPEY